MIEPSTFAERQRLFYDRFLVAAGVLIGVGAMALVLILAFGNWPEARYEQIITILGKALLGAGVSMVLVIVFLGLGGPVRRLKMALWKATLETESD